VSAGITELIDQFPMPAVVVSRYQDVLAANPMACALMPGFEVGQNLSRWRFTNAAAKEVFPDWEEATALAVGGLRALFAEDPNDSQLLALIDELSSSNDRFTELWEGAEVGYSKGVTHMRHPDVGDLYLTRTKLDLPNTGGAHIITWHAPPSSTSAHALEKLRATIKQH
jgi:hypothetical protein